ncbi:MAG: hypothetical protein COB12_13150 [Flavobacterium sp.]|nr:MAG: hypothetical protein COB12_13150 [Flavobacterium sp.]
MYIKRSQNTCNCLKDFITIANFTYQSEYVVLKLLLQREEIPFVFLNEIASSILPITIRGKGGIRLQVHKKNEEQVLKIISDLDKDVSLEIV